MHLEELQKWISGVLDDNTDVGCQQMATLAQEALGRKVRQLI